MRAVDLTHAFTLLRAAPTRAALSLTPDPARPVGLVGWHPATRLTETPFAAKLAAAYSDGLGTRHLAVGGACGLQHYAGRFFLAAIGAWVQTGVVPDPDHAAWRFRLDERGQTLGVAPPVAGGRPVDTAQEVAALLIGKHFDPIITQIRAATRITERLAHGCLAASCASAFAALHRRAPLRHQPALAGLAQDFLDAPQWRADRPLVELREISTPTGAALVHERRVFCLIRLGPTHSACGTCPELDAGERMAGIVRRATAAARGNDLPVGVPDVA